MELLELLGLRLSTLIAVGLFGLFAWLVTVIQNRLASRGDD
jgi:hypothetical protein